MKKVVAMMMVLAFAGSAFAADVIDLPAKNGNVKFNHKAHGAQGCTKCHADAKGGKIEGFAKDSAHKLCKGCHEEMKKGPTKCGECHKK